MKLIVWTSWEEAVMETKCQNLYIFLLFPLKMDNFLLIILIVLILHRFFFRNKDSYPTNTVSLVFLVIWGNLFVKIIFKLQI